MILDSSAVIAVILREPGFDGLLEKLVAADLKGIGAPTLAETGLVLTVKLGRDPRGLLKRFLAEADVETVPFTDLHWGVALEAYERFGKGRHKAALNFGDCLTYAIARLARQPLLCVGNDFSRTDLPLA